MAHEHRSVIFLLGPTATGKSELALRLAIDLGAEIISVDSTLVYRGLDIGTAKPTGVERAAVPHHLIDICDPCDPYSAARFQEDALACIDSIRQRNRIPLLVGGTMLYFQALEQGLAALPEADAAVRQRLIEQARLQGWPALHEQLARVDPVAARRIHPNDPQRLQRALEVYQLTGEPMSELQKRTSSRLAGRVVKFGLMPQTRAWLHARIAQRFESMLGAGLIDEVRQLRALPRHHADLPAFRSVGYRQVWQYLDGLRSTRQLNDQANAATRQLAKRQMTWMRSMAQLQLLPCDILGVNRQIDTILNTWTRQ